MKKKLIIPIEVKSRELDAKLLIALNLLQYSENDWDINIGYYKSVIPKSNTENIPFIMMLKGMENYEEFFTNIFSKGGRCVLLDEEGGIFSKFEEKNYPRAGYNHPCIKFVEKIFFWGEAEKNNYIRRHDQMSENKAVISGNPRFEISKKKYFNYFIKKNNLKLLGSNEKIILMNLAFGMANALIDPLEESNYWQSKQGGENTKALWSPLIEYEKKLLPIFLKDIKKLVNSHKNEVFVIRPHPVENSNTYKEYFSSCSNVKIIDNSSIQEWLPHAKILLHNGCTTAIEGFFADIESICYLPFYDKNFIQYLTLEVSDVIFNYSDLVTKLNNKLSKSDVWSESRKMKIKEAIKLNIDNTDYNSVEYIAKQIDLIDIFKPIIKIKNKYNIKKIIPIFIKNFLKNLIFFFKNNFKNNKKLIYELDSRNRKKFNELSKYEIINKINNYRLIDDGIPKITIKEIGEYVFNLRKE